MLTEDELSDIWLALDYAQTNSKSTETKDRLQALKDKIKHIKRDM